MSQFVTPYSNPAQISGPDLYTALKAAVAQYAFPLLPADNIRRGVLTGVSLPQSYEHCIITVLDRRRIGTNIKQYTVPPTDAKLGSLAEMTLWECSVQISFFSSSFLAEERAQSFKTFLRGSIGANFFRQYGIGAAYCEDIRILDQTDSTKRQIQHAIVTARLQYQAGISADIAFTGSVRIKNLYPLY